MGMGYLTASGGSISPLKHQSHKRISSISSQENTVFCHKASTKALESKMKLPPGLKIWMGEEGTTDSAAITPCKLLPTHYYLAVPGAWQRSLPGNSKGQAVMPLGQALRATGRSSGCNCSRHCQTQ
eukprot:1159194-Rhodomonas_salina.1